MIERGRNMEKNRIEYFDMAKGIGIILVVTGHSTFASDNLLTWLASFHMPLFFIISGMLLWHTKEENRDMKQIVCRKLKSIMLPYLTFSIISIIVKFLYLIRMPELITIKDIQEAFIATISLYGISVLWFLPALFVGETLFLWTRKKCNHTVTIAIGIVLFAIAVIGKPIIDANMPMQENIGFLFLGYLIKMLFRAGTAYLFLTIGYYTKAHILREKKKTSWKEIIFAVLFMAANIVLAFTNIRVDLNFLVFGNPFFFILAAYCGSMAVVLLCKNIHTIKPLTYFGVNSLIIMATHVECQIMMIGIRISSWLATFFENNQMLILYIFLTVSLIAMEVVTIYIFNHYLYFLIGKKRADSKWRRLR